MFRLNLFPALLTAAAIAIPSTARADFSYQIMTNTGGGTNSGVVPFGSNPGSFSGTYGGFAIAGGTASWSVSPTLGLTSSTALTITNNNPGTQTITIMVSVNGLMLPTSPLSYGSTVSGNYVVSGAGSTSTYTSYFSGTNTLFGLTNPIAFGPFVSNGTPLQDFGATGMGPEQSYGASGYAVTHVITATLLSGAVMQFNFSTIVAPVPEPATIVGAGIALASIGAFRFRKRRQPKA